MYRSRQGINIAFVGINHEAQIACAEYLKLWHGFKRMSMDEPLKKLVRANHDFKRWASVPWGTRIELYDAVYKVFPDLFIENINFRLDRTEVDTVIWDVRYMAEMKALKDRGFNIVRINTGSKPVHLKKYVRNAEKGTTAVAMTYDSNLAFQQNVDYSIFWSRNKGLTTAAAVDPVLQRMGFDIEASPRKLRLKLDN